jgi:hypothetical protein
MDNVNAELILHRLNDISRKQDELSKRVEDLTIELAKVKTIENAVDNLKEWKEKFQESLSISELNEFKDWKGKMDEQLSPTQLTNHLKEHASFKTFKTQALMIWVVVQGLMVVAIFWDKLFN